MDNNESKKDTKARKYQLTINNPSDNGFNHEVIKEQLKKFKSLVYWCLCDEIGGKELTYHTHIFIAFNDVVRFSVVKNKFPVAHIEGGIKGTCQQNRDYITKSGKWEKDKKKETNLPDTFEEEGIVPFERPGARNDITEQYDMIKQGMSNYEIMEQFEGNVDLTRVERMRLTYLSEKYKSQEREIKVIYISGTAGCGKTSGVLKEHGYEEVYKVDDWKHPFDSYNCEPIILLDDWRGGLTLVTDMLKWLDRYPLKLPCRYANKQACYTTVYITSNEELDTVYNGENTKVSVETRKAFLRRIHEVRRYVNGEVKVYTTEEYLNRDTEFVHISEFEQSKLPWNFS